LKKRNTYRNGIDNLDQDNVFFIFKKLFLISAHQNDLKISKIYYFEVNKKIKKKLIFLKNTFKTQKYTGKFLKIKPFPFPVR